ncbi:nitrous oxide reductase accessory protein NosL [Myroides odoratus]|uniref:nitrous oxide reductase accessory protein NosL n=1 Tax=Myroides odoratus TaxID=256 RepID=UPI0039AF32DE
MKLFAPFIFLLLFTSCTVKIQPIEYGTDSCDFCQMGIVDTKHASQLVTTKGKNYKFDAIECMVHYLDQTDTSLTAYQHILVADFLNPGVLLPAEQASFIISKQIPSPMGAFLSATQTQEKADKLLTEYTGERYTFSTLRQKLSNH